MKKNCEHYRIESKARYTEHPVTGELIKYNTVVGTCWGTKEIDECSCDGDRSKCDFYPEVREKAKKNVYIQDAINHFNYGISHDIFSEPVTTYAKLAVEALEKQIEENQ